MKKAKFPIIVSLVVSIILISVHALASTYPNDALGGQLGGINGKNP